MPATRKHLHVAKPRRRQRSVSLTTRASRCGVKNYVNVLKSLHPQVEEFFPVTKEYMQEYIEVKRKQNSIKANSLDQYFQHIESYNMALGHGWDAEVFEPMMRQVLENLEQVEEKTRVDRKLVTGDETSMDVAMSIGSEHDSQLNDVVGETVVDTNNNVSSGGYAPSVALVCFDSTHVPSTKHENISQVSLVGIDPDNFTLALRHIYDAVKNTRFPKRWGDIDISTIYYRNDAWSESSPYPLTDENSFKMFWTAYLNSSTGGEIQLVVYNRRSPKAPLVIGTDINSQSTSIQIAPLTPRKSPPRLANPPTTTIEMITESPVLSPTFQQVKAVTIRSPSKVYKANIAVTDSTTFDSLLKFAIGKRPPAGKQFVLQSADGELEYMPEDPVRKVIFGTGHAEDHNSLLIFI
ncbi:hypothetical protein G9A89_005304 [Geosiphon pyriformis]|nr:hypothetical protein G9A89_005304 [Geosiphon pyriformis]